MTTSAVELLDSLDPHVSVDTELTQLIIRSAGGDHDAFADLYDRTSTRTYHLVLRVMRCPDHAAEVTQDIYTELWQLAGRYDRSRGSALGWIMTIAHRRAVDRIRALTRIAARDNAWAGEHSELGAADEVWQWTSSRLDGDRVRRGMRSLSPVQREALDLTYLGGYSAIEVARLLEVPLGTVKTRMRDGLIRLRGAVQLELELELGAEA